MLHLSPGSTHGAMRPTSSAKSTEAAGKGRRVSQSLLLASLSAVLMLGLTACPFSAAQKSSPRSLTFGGLERSYRVFVPEDYTAESPVPLVLVLHGGGGGGTRLAEALGFDDSASAHHYIAAYPEGVGKEWNDGRGVRFRSDQAGAAIDDVGFLVAVVHAIEGEFAIDSTRVYVTGVSNGAMMTHRLILEAPDIFAAAAPVIGALAKPLLDEAPSAQPIPILMINGTDDRAVPFEGGYVFNNEDFGELASVAETDAFWRAANACEDSPTVTELPDLDTSDGSTVSLQSYSCTNAPVEQYIVEGGGHRWPAESESSLSLGRRGQNHDFSATEVIWTFFSQYSRE